MHAKYAQKAAVMQMLWFRGVCCSRSRQPPPGSRGTRRRPPRNSKNANMHQTSFSITFYCPTSAAQRHPDVASMMPKDAPRSSNGAPVKLKGFPMGTPGWFHTPKTSIFHWTCCKSEDVSAPAILPSCVLEWQQKTTWCSLNRCPLWFWTHGLNAPWPKETLCLSNHSARWKKITLDPKDHITAPYCT